VRGDYIAWVPQTALFGDTEDMHEIAGAVRKIQENVREML
jgi:hypothetical protein